MITVKFFTLLRLLVKKADMQVEWQKEDTIGTILNKAQDQVGTNFLPKLIDHSGDLKTGTMILLNGKNIFHLDKLQTAVQDGDTIDLFPPGGGG